MLSVLLLASTVALAASEDGARLFQSGRAAFEAGNYAGALESFESALKAQLDGPALHFNIGVTAYRLGRYQRAESAFLDAARTPEMAALAHYNLGLIALAQGDRKAARRWFERSQGESRDDRLRSLASTQLERLTPSPTFPWSGYAALAAGYDDNVALVSDSDVLGVSGLDDMFVDGTFVATVPIGESWRVDAGALLLTYKDLSQFNQITAHGGGRYRLRAGDWTGDVGLQLSYGTLGGESFQNEQAALLQGGRALSEDWRLRLAYGLSNVDGQGEFASISGTRHEGRARLIWDTSPWRMSAEYQMEDSNQRDDALSMTRHQVGIGVERALDAMWTLACELTRSHSSFDSAASGDENRTELDASVARAMGTSWQIVLRYLYVDNDADRSEFSYRRNRVLIGVEMTL